MDQNFVGEDFSRYVIFQVCYYILKGFFGVSIADFEQVNAGLLFSSVSFNNHVSPIRDFHF